MAKWSEIHKSIYQAVQNSPAELARRAVPAVGSKHLGHEFLVSRVLAEDGLLLAVGSLVAARWRWRRC